MLPAETCRCPLTPLDPRRADSGLGGRLVDGFAQQLGGQVEWKSGRHGTTVQLILPLP